MVATGEMKCQGIRMAWTSQAVEARADCAFSKRDQKRFRTGDGTKIKAGMGHFTMTSLTVESTPPSPWATPRETD
jgi:hypothetical protein